MFHENWEAIDITSANPARRYELDWLRVLVIINLVPWHAAWLMVTIPGFTDIPQRGFKFNVLRYYVSLTNYWQMPLLFFVAGIATYFSLGSRSPKEYIWERSKRLIVPLMFYMVILQPILGYFWPLSPPPASVSDHLLSYSPNYFSRILSVPSPVAGTTMPGWTHLWFVAYLFTMSIIALPLFHYLRGRPNSLSENRLINLIVKRHGIILMAIPLILIHAVLSPIWPMFQFGLYRDWAYFLCNMTLFIYGYLFCVEKRLWSVVANHWRKSLLMGIATYIAISVMRHHLPTFSTPAYTLCYAVYSAIFGLHVWLWIVGLLGFAGKFLSHPNAFLKYFSPASYPFYILHMVLIIIIGCHVTQWHLEAPGEFVVLSILTFIVTLGSYEVFVKRTKLTRFLFGMKI